MNNDTYDFKMVSDNRKDLLIRYIDRLDEIINLGIVVGCNYIYHPDKSVSVVNVQYKYALWGFVLTRSPKWLSYYSEVRFILYGEPSLAVTPHEGEDIDLVIKFVEDQMDKFKIKELED